MKPKNFNNEIIDVASMKLYIRKLIPKNLSMAETHLLLRDATRMPYILLQTSGNRFQMHSKINSKRKYREI